MIISISLVYIHFLVSLNQNLIKSLFVVTQHYLYRFNLIPSHDTRFRMFLRLRYRAMRSCMLNGRTIVQLSNRFSALFSAIENLTRQLLNRQFISIATGRIRDVARQLFYFPLSWRAWSRTARNCCPRSLRRINRSFCRTQHARTLEVHSGRVK